MFYDMQSPFLHVKYYYASTLCERKGVEIIKTQLYLYHVHMLLSIRYGNNQFWCRGYYVDTVGGHQQIRASLGLPATYSYRVEQAAGYGLF